MTFRSTLILVVLLCCASFANALELKDITFNTEGAGKVVFSHSFHLKKKSRTSANVSCKSCHNENMKSHTHYTMAQMERGKSCGMCHNGKKAFELKNCTGCHKVKDITFRIKQAGTVVFSHAKHLKKMECNSCHTKIFATGPNKSATMAEMEKGKSCGACHNGKKAFNVDNCAACHPVKEVVFKVKATGPTPFSHKKHTAMYKCNDCHTKLFNTGVNKPVTMAQMGKGKSCGACHNGKVAFAVSDCAKCHPVKDINFKVKDISNAHFSHSVHIGMYKCNECHPAIFMPTSDAKPVTMAQMEKGKSCGACHDGKTAFTVMQNCDKCHN